ncbi:MAG TPA: trypsin-like peptidase domain-containing protein [Planctomycetota bacterium]|nr:trypsin-like peptidase domain-containing protein [Planctomycetota bacterium]
MKDILRSIAVAAFLAAGVAAGVGLGRAFDARGEAPRPPAARPEPPAVLASLQESFHAVAEAAMPSVVHITTQVGGGLGDFFQPMMGVGSGVIVSEEGHIVTNNHVVDAGADRLRALRVRFVDGKEYPAKVLGTDPESDLALLKISARGAKLAPIPFADSDRVRVGDWCLAIGSPFGYNHTVTAGIVSAKHRRAQLGLPYQDFLQTDAAINPGNSGGALVNLKGELVGINTAIVSQTRGNDGVGFAISSNLVKWVSERLQREGRVRRGYLGVKLADLDAQLVEALRQEYGIGSLEELLDHLGLKEARGAFVFEVEPGTPAAEAGFKDKDVILEFNGERVAGQGDMLFKVARLSPGTEVTVKVLRDRRERELRVKLGERPPIDLRRRR